MNILHIISSAASGGAEILVKDLAKHMVKTGHEIHVAFLDSAEEAGRDLVYEQLFLNELHQAGVKTFIIGHVTRKKPWLGWYRTRRYIKNNKIDIVHSHMVYGVFFSAFSFLPIVFTRHGHGKRWNKMFYLLLNSLVDCYISVSSTSAKALLSYTGRQVFTIHNGISLDRFERFSRVRKINDNINIAMVGRLVKEKDYPTAIQAISLLPSKLRERIKVRIVGEERGFVKKELQGLIKESNLSQHVELVGVINNIPQFLYDSDVFLMSSDTEGLPIALIEANASGLPCLVTDVGGCKEVINKCQSGLVVNPKDPTSLASALEKLLSNEDKFKLYSYNALKYVDAYSIDLVTNKHIDIYNTLFK